MFALVRQFQALIGADSDLAVDPDDCDYSVNKKGDYNGYDGGFVVNVSCRGSRRVLARRAWRGVALGAGACAPGLWLTTVRAPVQYNLFDESPDDDDKYPSNWSSEWAMFSVHARMPARCLRDARATRSAASCAARPTRCTAPCPEDCVAIAWQRPIKSAPATSVAAGRRSKSTSIVLAAELQAGVSCV